MLRRHTDGRELASDIFKGRDKEAAIFADVLESHQQRLNRKAEQSAPSTPMAAHNILVFHGMGGVGKSALSKRLESWVVGNLPRSDPWGPGPRPPMLATGRFDFFGSRGSVDPTEVILTLRKTLSSVKPKWPAFDWALATWWSASHPDVPLPTIRGRQDRRLRDSLTSVLSDVLSDLGLLDTAVGITVGTTRKAVETLIKLSDRKIAENVVDDQDWFKDLLQRLMTLPSREDPRPDLLIEAAELIELELSYMKSHPTVVMFLDTFERLQDESGYTSSGERAVHEIVWNVPSVLFVVTGRSALSWADRRRLDLPHSGPQQWPGLVKADNSALRQFLIGCLSEAETRELLQSVRDTESLPLDNEVLDVIVVRSKGLPVYINLVLSRIRSSKEVTNGMMVADAVDDTLEALVERVMNDIPLDERRVLRSASMFSSFSANLVAASSCEEMGTVLRALQRPIVEKWIDPSMPYRMHDAVRHAIREADPIVYGGWALEDWRQAATRALAHYRELIELATEEQRRSDVLRLTAGAIALVCSENVQAALEPSGDNYSDWLVKQIVRGPSIAALHADLPLNSKTEYGEGLIRFVRAKMPGVSVIECRQILRELSNSDHPVAVTARRHLLYSYRAHDEIGLALKEADKLVDADDRSLHRYLRRSVLAGGRRFKDALDGIDFELEDAPRRAMMLKARVRTYHGCMDSYDSFQDLCSERVLELEREGRLREADEFRASILFRCALFTGRVDSSQLRHELDVAVEHGHKSLERMVRAAMVLVSPHGESATSHLRAMKKIDNLRGGRMVASHAVSLCAWAWLHGEDTVLRAVSDRLGEQSHLTYNWIPVEQLISSLGYKIDVPDTQWLEPYLRVEERWGQIWCAWLDRISLHQGE